MADTKPSRKWRLLLIVSLALNLAVVGAVGGLALRSAGDKGGPRGFDFGLGPVGGALDRGDRRAISQALRSAPGLRPPSRGENRDALNALVMVLRAEPLSEDALRTVLNEPSQRVTQMRDAAVAALQARIVAMTPEQRAAFADRIESGDGKRRKN